jgi:hypothetical protein
MAITAQVYAYNRAVELLTQFPDTYNYGSGNVVVSLHSTAYTPNASHTYDSDLRGEVSGGNYTRKKLQGREVVFDTATGRIQFNATRVVWPLSTISARYAVIRISTTSSPSMLVGWVDLGATRQTNNASFIIGWENDRILEIEGVNG